MDAFRGQGLQVQEPAARPFACRHNAMRGGERLTFAIVLQRQVDEDREAKPVRLGDKHFRHTRGDQAVNQNKSIFRTFSEYSPEPARVHGSWPGPRAGHGVLKHRPSQRPQPVTDPPVVSVAPARMCGIVDVTRQDNVDDAHNARS